MLNNPEVSPASSGVLPPLLLLPSTPEPAPRPRPGLLPPEDAVLVTPASENCFANMRDMTGAGAGDWSGAEVSGQYQHVGSITAGLESHDHDFLTNKANAFKDVFF